MKRLFSILFLFGFVLFGAHAFAQDASGPVEEVPFESMSEQEDDYFEQQITIIEGEHVNRAEYRVGGQLRAVKIIPEHAPAYFLVDQNGDGEFSNVELLRQQSMKISRWVIFEFD